jgi:hypothetical protein
MYRVLVVILLLLIAAGAGLGVAWIYANMIYKPPSYSSPKNIPLKNEPANDLDKIIIFAQSPLEGDFGKLAMTSIEKLLLKSLSISGNEARLTFSYLTSKGESGTLILNAKYVFYTENSDLYYLGSGPFPFKIGDKVNIDIEHVENKGDTSNARMIEFIRTNPRITSPEGKQIREVAIGNFGDTVLTREDLTRRLEQGGDVRLEDNEIQVIGLKKL